MSAQPVCMSFSGPRQGAFSTRRPSIRLAWRPRASERIDAGREPRRCVCQAAPEQAPLPQRRAALVESLQQSPAPWRQAGLSVLAALLLTCEPAQAAETLQGVARAVDGDTLEVAGTRIRLFGVDAPEKAQTCTLNNGREYACGQLAKDALTAKIGQAPVLCEVKNKDLYGRTVAACAAGGGRGGDLGSFMVENGWAVAYRQYSKAYVSLEEQAHAAGRGIWGGSFQEPALWRKEHPRNGSAAANSLPASATPVAAVPGPSAQAVKGPPSPNCAIKGNINAKKEKIYHVPGGRSYDATDIDTTAGERWFCSEKEAQEAGWRASKN